MKKRLLFFTLVGACPCFGMHQAALDRTVKLQAMDGSTCTVDLATLHSPLVDRALVFEPEATTVKVENVPTAEIIRNLLALRSLSPEDLTASLSTFSSQELITIINAYDFLFRQSDWLERDNILSLLDTPDPTLTRMAQFCLEKMTRELGTTPIGGEALAESYTDRADAQDSIVWRFIEHQYRRQTAMPTHIFAATSSVNINAPIIRCPENTALSAFSTFAAFRDNDIVTPPLGGILLFDKRGGMFNLLDGRGFFNRQDADYLAARGTSDAAWSPDGRMFATASPYSAAWVWSVRTRIYGIPHPPQARAHTVAWNCDSNILAIGYSNGLLELWLVDVQTSTIQLPGGVAQQSTRNFKQLHTLPHTGRIIAIAWSPDGKIIASASSNRTVTLWNPADGTHLHTLNHNDNVTHIAWNPNGHTLVTRTTAGTMSLWYADGNFLTTLNDKDGHIDQSHAVAWSPDGRMLATGSYDHTAKLWRPDGALVHILAGPNGHTDQVTAVGWNPDGQTLATGSWDCSVKLWNADNGAYCGTLDHHKSGISAVIWNFGGNTLATAGLDGQVVLWNPTATAPVLSATLQELLLVKLFNNHATGKRLSTNELVNLQPLYESLPGPAKEIADQLEPAFYHSPVTRAAAWIAGLLRQTP